MPVRSDQPTLQNRTAGWTSWVCAKQPVLCPAKSNTRSRLSRIAAEGEREERGERKGLGGRPAPISEWEGSREKAAEFRPGASERDEMRCDAMRCDAMR
eukprot:3596316-Rhodomonas_salina.2